MKYIFFLILLILFCKDSDSKENKEKLILYSSWYKVQSDINYKNTYCYSINVPSDTPDCFKDMIKIFLNQRVDSPPFKLTKYLFKGESFYSRSCCGYSKPAWVEDKNCNLYCSDAGGIAENTSGGCKDFFANATNETLIWEDRRTESGGCK